MFLYTISIDTPLTDKVKNNPYVKGCQFCIEEIGGGKSEDLRRERMRETGGRRI